ncbi:MAG: diacylglycerol kinase [Sphingobium sp.]|nr:diacylglycerol kinase [Sphingobium sp.]
MKKQPFRRRLGFALAGIAEGWRGERSLRTHIVSAVATLAALALLRPPPIWWAVIVLVIALVLASELLNSAIEGLVDHLHPEIHPRIRVVKDMAAGAVLTAAIAALMIAGLLALDML